VELQEIEVFIDASGEVRVEVKGVTGPSCLAMTAGLESALGAEIVSREVSPEAAAAIEVTQEAGIRQQIGNSD
jgi:hypothetical protein